MTVDDSLAQLGLWSGITAEREDFFRALEMSAVSGDSNGNISRGAVSYQTFEEKIRSRGRFYLWQKHDSFRCNADVVRTSEARRLHMTSELLVNRLTFDSGYDYYTRFSVDGALDLLRQSRVSCRLVGRYLYDWGDASRLGGGVTAGLRVAEGLSAYVTGDVSSVPPSDMARFLKPGGYVTDRNGSQDYNHGGDRGLEPTTLTSLSGALRFECERYGLVATGRISRVDDLVIWQRYEGAEGGLYTSEARDADLCAMTVIGEVSPFGDLWLNSEYTFARLQNRDTDDDLSLMPRHNLYASLSCKQRIGNLQLEVFPSIEIEYHSENYRNHFNYTDLGEYLLVHGRLSARIKSFTFYYTMENIFDREHETVYGYPCFRRVWWGFRWIFIN
jgi:hypothetical protein